MMRWRRLDRETSQNVLESVKSASDAGLFSLATSEVESAILPFYKDFKAYKVTNYASLPSFSFTYLGDGQFFHFLDGSPEPVVAVNDKGQLQLTETNVTEYLAFYFENVGNEDGGERYFIQNPQDMPLFDSLDEDTEDAIIRNHKAPIVTFDAADGLFTVVAEIYVDGQVNRAHIEVKKGTGRIRITNQTMIWNEPGENQIETIA